MAACQMRRVLVVRMAPAAYVAATIACWSVAIPTVHGQESTAAEKTAMTPRNDRVVLPAAKTPFIGLKTERFGRRRLQSTRVAPGRLRYDERRHVEVKTAAAGIVRQILVKPGDRVEAGQLLAVITSAEVGQIRADLMRLTAVRDLAVKRLQRARAIEEGVNRLVDQIASDVEPRQAANLVEKFDLGEYRAPLLSAYAAWRLAESLYRNGEAAGGSLSGRQLEERRSEYVAAQGALGAAREQAMFDTEVARLEAENRVDDAERRVAISAQYAAALQGAAAIAADTPPSDLSELRLLAPIAGSIELQHYAVSERIAAGDGLFVVADTSQLWVEADIREQEWGALGLAPGQTITVTGPTVGEEPLTATVHYVGREVSSTTNAASLVATIDNPRGTLRPGQFVQVRVPVAEAREVLAIPESAVVQHDGQAFVFVQESATSFRRVNVRTGMTADGMIEVTDGLSDGAALVTHGAFELKSELLLDREDE